MIPPVRTSPPAALPVSLGDLKAHAVIDFSDDDAIAEAYLGAAVAYLDGYDGVLGRCLVSQQWRQDFRDWRERLRLPFPDVSEVAVTYLDVDGAEQDVAPELVELVQGSRGSYVRFKDAFSDPSLDDDRDYPVSIKFTAGYGTAEDVPGPLKVAILLLAAHWYDQRKAATIGSSAESLPFGFDMLISPYRRVGV